MASISEFADLHMRAADAFTAELRQSCRLVLTYATNPQITALIEGADEVFASQAFPPPGAPTVPGWANVRELLADPKLSQHAPQAAEYAPAVSTADLRPGSPTQNPTRWSLSA